MKLIRDLLAVFLLGMVTASCTEISIEETTVKKHLYTLASDEMEGRGSGTRGIEKAAQYIEGEFEKYGLKTYNSLPSYRQNFKEMGLDLFNVIGILEGKSKKNEYVIISAHYDHLGVRTKADGKDGIYNGADDNASGTTALLMMAAYFAKHGDNERTLIFAAFTAEEKGLVGSTHFAKGIDANNFVAGINIEMIGRESNFGPKTAWLTGFDRSDFGSIIQKNLEGTGYKLYKDPYEKYDLFFKSDNASLARLGIPSHTFSTGPIDTHPDYHQASDEVENLDISTITETIKAIIIGTNSIISGEDTPSRVVIKLGE